VKKTWTLVMAFIQLVLDYADIDEDLTTVRQHHDAAEAIGHNVSRLAEREFFVGAAMRRMLLTGGATREGTPWPILRLDVQRATDAQVVTRTAIPWNRRASMKPNEAIAHPTRKVLSEAQEDHLPC
jgi:hypothetical protein